MSIVQIVWPDVDVQVKHLVKKTQDNPNHALTMQQIHLSCIGNKFELIDIIFEQVIKKR